MMLEMGELFQLCVILHFPPEVYLRRGVGELAPLLVRALHENEISALQFLRGGLARVTVRSSAYREELLSSDFLFEDTPIPVTPADCQTISVYLCDLPVEISDDSVRSALQSFGDVFSVYSTVYNDFPSIRNGTHVLLMSVKQPIPSSLNVLGFTCRTWYPGQPAFCSICRQSGHLPRACPLSGLCRRCKQPGHVARECPQARGSSQSSSVPEVPPDPVPEVPPHPVPDVPPDPAPAPVSMSDDPPVSTTSAPVSSIPPAPVTAVSTPVPSVLPVSTSSSRPSTSACVHKSPLTASSAVSADIKKLSRLLMIKACPHSVFHASEKGDYYTLDLDVPSIYKLCQAILKTHKLNLSDDEVRAVAAAVADK